jgi:hypothetical protein
VGYRYFYLAKKQFNETLGNKKFNGNVIAEPITAHEQELLGFAIGHLLEMLEALEQQYARGILEPVMP